MIGVQPLSLISATAAVLWLGIIVLLHFMMPELDPRTRMVSEYARQLGGWLMRLAFLFLAMSCCALAALTAAVLPPLGPALLSLCGVAAAGAGVFVTDPVLLTDRTQTRSGGLHVLFALIVILLFPIMATIVGIGLDASIKTRPLHALLSLLAWVGLLSFMAATVYSGRRPATPLGYFERVLILAYSAWLIATDVLLAA
jgi:Protein of unknown function (DUF998)